jgi:predicted glutamine amidotransferase
MCCTWEISERQKAETMCDLFALSSEKDYSAPKSLPMFADLGWMNMDGWGIGYFRKHLAHVEKSAERVYYAGHVHDSFQRLARVVNSKIIISHIRLRTSGRIDECHAHPFILHFGYYDWIFAHNGKATAIESYRTEGPTIPDAVSDSARAFEYLRDRLVPYYLSRGSNLSTLFDALYKATGKMIDSYPGKYNYILTNGHALFAFNNHRQFMLLRGSRKLEGGLLLTTIAHGLSDEQWVKVSRPADSKGVLLAVVGSSIIAQETL